MIDGLPCPLATQPSGGTNAPSCTAWTDSLCGYRQLYCTLPVYLREHGQPVGVYATLIAIGSGMILMLEVPATMAMRRWPPTPVIVAGYCVVGLGMALFALISGRVRGRAATLASETLGNGDQRRGLHHVPPVRPGDDHLDRTPTRVAETVREPLCNLGLRPVAPL